MIKYNRNNINEWYDGSTLIHKAMYNRKVIYQRFLIDDSNNRFTFKRANGESGVSECSTSTTFSKRDIYAIDANYDTIKSIKIGKCIDTIDEQSIGMLKVIQSVDMSNSNVTSIGNNAFSPFWTTAPSVLTSVSFSPTLQTIKINAFANCTALKTLNFPSSLTSIYHYAFENCTALYDVSSLSGTNLTKIDYGTFSGCTALAKVELPSSCREIMFDAFNGTAIRTLDLKNVTTLGDRFVAHCPNLSSITINEGTSVIPVQCFVDCTSLQSVGIPSTIVSIGSYAFYNCQSLTSVTLPNGLLTIGDKAFDGYGSMSLTSVSIPSSVVTLGSTMFDSSLSYVVFEGTVPPTINSDTFNHSITTTPTYWIYVPDEALEDYKTATNWTNYVDRIKPISEKQ